MEINKILLNQIVGFDVIEIIKFEADNSIQISGNSNCCVNDGIIQSQILIEKMKQNGNVEATIYCDNCGMKDYNQIKAQQLYDILYLDDFLKACELTLRAVIEWYRDNINYDLEYRSDSKQWYFYDGFRLNKISFENVYRDFVKKLEGQYQIFENPDVRKKVKKYLDKYTKFNSTFSTLMKATFEI